MQQLGDDDREAVQRGHGMSQPLGEREWKWIGSRGSWDWKGTRESSASSDCLLRGGRQVIGGGGGGSGSVSGIGGIGGVGGNGGGGTADGRRRWWLVVEQVKEVLLHAMGWAGGGGGYAGR